MSITGKNVSTLGLLHMVEGVAKIICCCAKLVFMLFTIGLWHRLYASGSQPGSNSSPGRDFMSSGEEFLST